MKTYKREAGALALASVGANAAAGFMYDSDTAVRILEIITTPAFMFATAMFGADWMGKQSPWAANEEGPLE